MLGNLYAINSARVCGVVAWVIDGIIESLFHINHFTQGLRQNCVKNENPESLKIGPGIPLPVSTNKVESYDISTNILDSTKVRYESVNEAAKPAASKYFNVIIYYVIALHAAVIYFFLEKKGFFEKEKNPFK